MSHSASRPLRACSIRRLRRQNVITVKRWTALAFVIALIAVTLSLGAISAPPANAVSVAPIDLGLAAPFAILAGDSIGNTATGPTTIVRGDVGVLAAAGAVTGFPPGLVRGHLYASGAPEVVAAHAAIVTAYDEATNRPSDFALAGDLIGLTLHPGVHTNIAAVANTGTVTLDGDGDTNAVFIFQVGGALAMAAGAKVVLTNGTQAKNVFWQVDGAGAVGAGAQFAGTLMTSAAIGVGANSSFNGRALALTGAITTNSNQFYSSPPAVTIDGGSVANIADDTPTISGTAVIDLPATVTVTIQTQVLLAAVQANGTWSVVAAILPNAVYPVVATVVDAVGNPGTATQSLTIDTVLPVVGIVGGPTRLTGNASPTIAGTTDVAPSSVVTVTVDGQVLTALVQSAGTWNVTAAPLSDGTKTVVASVVDEAGNPGSATQTLTIDTVAPVVFIAGGNTALTNDPSPTISGTSTDPGAAVTVTVSGVTMLTTVQGNGTWSVTSATLADGPHPVAVSIDDPAGNSGVASQSLTIDTIAPGMTLAGGAAISTTDTTPTIIGSTPAAPGSVVTMTVAGQTWTTLVQLGGSWNITPNALAIGTHTVSASVADLAGNISTATLSLDITAAPGTTPPTGTIPPGGTPPGLPAASAFAPVGPHRVFDTRLGQSPGLLRTVNRAKVGGPYVLEVRLVDLEGFVPATGVGAVSLNVTVANSEASGFVTVYACGAREAVSSVNFAAGQTVANAVIAPVSAQGNVCFYASQPTDIIVDINGWLPEGQAFAAVGPKRLFDTRLGASDQTLRAVQQAPIDSGAMIEVQVTDLAGVVPAVGVDSVSLNVTVTNPVAYGFITVYACGTREAVSSVNYVAGQTVANAVIAPISAQGTVCFFAVAQTDLVVDINGWFKASQGFTGVSPKRLFDTRAGSGDALRSVAKIKIGGAYVLEVHVNDLAGIVPASGVAAVSLNVTATNADADGYVTVFACGAREDVSSLNYAAGRTVANAVLAPVSATGTICLYSLAPTDVVVDLNGWFATPA